MNRFYFLDSVLLKSKQVTYNRNHKFYCFETNNFGLCYILFIFFITAFLFVSCSVNYFLT